MKREGVNYMDQADRLVNEAKDEALVAMIPKSYPHTRTEIVVGETYRIPYPFCWEKFTAYPVKYGSGVETNTWRPGTVREVDGEYGPYGEPEEYAVAHGMGFMLAEVISIHKPGRFPERVFFVRTWETPTGKAFGKAKLRITTTQAFRRLLKGYRYDYELVEEDGPGKVDVPVPTPKLDDVEVPF